MTSEPYCAGWIGARTRMSGPSPHARRRALTPDKPLSALDREKPLTPRPPRPCEGEGEPDGMIREG
jgi:hypothetical protein